MTAARSTSNSRCPNQEHPNTSTRPDTSTACSTAQLLKSRTNFKGDFAVNTNPGLLWKKGLRTDAPVLKLGSSARADELRALEIEEVAFQFRYAESMNSCFDLPMETR